MQPAISIHPDVQQAINDGAPIVALETAVLTHGLPQTPGPIPLRQEYRDALDPSDLAAWNDDLGAHHNVVRMMANAVRRLGAHPAVVGIVNGVLHVGLDDEQLTALANADAPAKAAVTDLAALHRSTQCAGTTVSGTLAACHALDRASGQRRPPITTFATGGIGGVHRNWARMPDVSADLHELARTRCLVVSAGAKSLLDLPATLEWLETLCVPVAGWQSDLFAAFTARSTIDLPLRHVMQNADAAAKWCRTHWEDLGIDGGLLLSNPLPQDIALNAHDVDRWVDDAESAADEAGVGGQQRTPFVLDLLMRLSGGLTLEANLTLLVRNAALAAEIAAAAR